MRQVSAILIADNYEISSSVAELREDLRALSIDSIVLDDSDLLFNGIGLCRDTTYLYFRNAFIRVSDLSALVEFLRQDGANFSSVWIGKELVAITAEYISGGGTSFSVSNLSVSFKKPDVEPVRTLMYAHRRAAYFRLSLQSVLYGMGDDLDLDIFLSAPSEEVQGIAGKAALDYPGKVRVYKTEANVAMGAINLWLQLVRPATMLLFEEDYILPQYVRHLVPYWTRQIAWRLRTHDMVFLETSTDNTCYDLYRTFTPVHPPTVRNPGDHVWYHNPSGPNVTGNGMAVNVPFYTGFAAQPPFYINGDGFMYERATNRCVSSIRGYHIGWNQEMDGWGRPSGMRFPSPEPVQCVINCLTGEKTILDMRNIKKALTCLW